MTIVQRGKPRVFLDSSVLITALLSSRGGSFYLLNYHKSSIAFQTSEYVLMEVNRVILEKFPHRELRARLFLLLGIAGVAVLPNPHQREVKKLAELISLSDAPILASAAKSSDCLLTLDNEFFQARIRRFAARRGVEILKPREFIASVRGVL